MNDPRATTPLDVEIGLRLRRARRAARRSQEWLAAALEVSTQQLQKYETGRNRLTASKVFMAAQALNLPMSAFFPASQVPEPDLSEGAPTTCDTASLTPA